MNSDSAALFESLRVPAQRRAQPQLIQQWRMQQYDMVRSSSEICRASAMLAPSRSASCGFRAASSRSIPASSIFRAVSAWPVLSCRSRAMRRRSSSCTRSKARGEVAQAFVHLPKLGGPLAHAELQVCARAQQHLMHVSQPQDGPSAAFSQRDDCSGESQEQDLANERFLRDRPQQVVRRNG